MQNLKVALVQANQIWENKRANLTNYERLLENIEDVDLILLPEMFHTGFSMNAEFLAEDMENSMGLEWLKKIAEIKNTAIYTSLIIQENGVYHNRGVFVPENGEFAIYDKRKTFGLAGEDKIYKAGTKETIVNYRNWLFQLQICYDLRFPEIVRNNLSPNQNPAYDVILYVANWPQKRIEHWKILLKARAIENQCYVIGVNRMGTDGKGLEYTGESMLCDALGTSLMCGESIEEVKIVQLNKEELIQTRELLPFLKDR